MDKNQSRPKLSRSKKILYLLLFLFLVLGFFGLVGEIMVRVLDLYRDGRTNPTIYQKSTLPERVFELKPNTQGYSHGAWVETNSYGLRGPEFSLTKKEKTCRILCLGDSVTFGVGVSNEQTYPAQLQKLLNQAGKTVEVLNAGTCSYNWIQEYHWFLSKGTILKPDIIVLQWCENDFNSANDLSQLPSSPSVSSSKGNFSFPLKHFLQENSCFYHFLRIRYDQWLRTLKIRPVWEKKVATLTKENCRNYNQQVLQWQSTLAKEGIQLLLVTFPVFELKKGIRPGENEHHQILTNKLTALSLAEKMGGSQYHQYKLAWDSHPSAKGHLEMAKQVFEKLKQLNWIP